MHKLWITILLSPAILLAIIFEPFFPWFHIKVYAGLLDPSSPRIHRGVLTSGSYRRATQLCSRRPSLINREALSPLLALRGPGRLSRPSWVIILTQHTYSHIFRTSIQPLGLHLSIHQPTDMITVTFILRVYEP